MDQWSFCISANVSGCRTRSLGATFAQANGVTGQGLGVVSAANEAGNPVLGDVGFCLYFR